MKKFALLLVMLSCLSIPTGFAAEPPAAPPAPAPAQEEIDPLTKNLLDSFFEDFNIDWSPAAAARRRAQLAPLRITEVPPVVIEYFNLTFNPKTDDLLATPPLPEDRRKRLMQSRLNALALLAHLNTDLLPYMSDAVRGYDKDQTADSLALLDRFLRTVRLQTFRRALKVDEPDIRRKAVEASADSGDLRLLPDVLACLEADKVPPTESLPALRLLELTPGRTEMMRSIISARYLRKAGDLVWLEKTLRESIANCKPGADDLKAGMYAQSLARIDTPTARAEVLRLLKDEAAAALIKEGIAAAAPDFFDAERAQAALAFYKGLAEPRDSRFAEFLDWLRANDCHDGVAVTNQVLKSLRTKLRAIEDKTERVKFAREIRAIELYLIWAGDEKLLAPLVTQASAPEAKTFAPAMMTLAQLGLWTKFPMGWEEKIHQLPFEDRLALLELVRKADSPRVMKFAEALTADGESAYPALCVTVGMGKAGDADALRRAMAGQPADAKVAALSVLYRAGQADVFDALVKIASAPELHYTHRIEAIRALAASPEALKTKAIAALVAAQPRTSYGSSKSITSYAENQPDSASPLLSPYGDISQAAHETLVKLTGKKDVEFSPWADDATRKAQAVKWRAAAK